MELGDAGLPAAAARRLRLQPLARPACAAFAGRNSSDRIRGRRSDAPDRPHGGHAAARCEHLPLGAVAALRLDRAVVPARLRPGAADPALVCLERRRRSVPAVRGVQRRQFLRPDRLPIGGRAFAPGGDAEAGVERRLCLARPARRLVRAAAASPIVGGSSSGGGALDRLANLRRLDPPCRDSVGPDARDHAPYHHRSRRDAVAVGAPARPLSPELHRRFRSRPPLGERHRPGGPRRAARRRLRRFLEHAGARRGVRCCGALRTVLRQRRDPSDPLRASARPGAPHDFLPRHVGRRGARRPVLRADRAFDLRLDLRISNPRRRSRVDPGRKKSFALGPAFLAERTCAARGALERPGGAVHRVARPGRLRDELFVGADHLRQRRADHPVDPRRRQPAGVRRGRRRADDRFTAA